MGRSSENANDADNQDEENKCSQQFVTCDTLYILHVQIPFNSAQINEKYTRDTIAHSVIFHTPFRKASYLAFQPAEINATNNLALEQQEQDDWRNTGEGQSSDQIGKG